MFLSKSQVAVNTLFVHFATDNRLIIDRWHHKKCTITMCINFFRTELDQTVGSGVGAENECKIWWKNLSIRSEDVCKLGENMTSSAHPKYVSGLSSWKKHRRTRFGMDLTFGDTLTKNGLTTIRVSYPCCTRWLLYKGSGCSSGLCICIMKPVFDASEQYWSLVLAFRTTLSP